MIPDPKLVKLIKKLQTENVEVNKEMIEEILMHLLILYGVERYLSKDEMLDSDDYMTMIADYEVLGVETKNDVDELFSGDWIDD